MNAFQLVCVIEDTGASIRYTDGKLKVRGDHHLSENLRDCIRSLRPQLVALLKDGDLVEELPNQEPGGGTSFTNECSAPPSCDFDDGIDSYVPLNADTGARAICAMLQTFPLLFDALHRDALPSGDCCLMGDHDVITTLPNAASWVREVEIVWTRIARDCKRERRLLTQEEEQALTRDQECLEWLNAANQGDGTWADLTMVDSL